MPRPGSVEDDHRMSRELSVPHCAVLKPQRQPPAKATSHGHSSLSEPASASAASDHVFTGRNGKAVEMVLLSQSVTHMISMEFEVTVVGRSQVDYCQLLVTRPRTLRWQFSTVARRRDSESSCIQTRTP